MRLLFFCVVLFPLSAAALDNDPALNKLCTAQGNDASSPCGDARDGAIVRGDQAAFAEVAREYGMAFSPKLLAPAETLGINGFQFAVQVGITDINETEDYWSRSVEDGDPPSVLVTTQLDMRKGLPYSFEVGAHATYLINSELWAFGGSLKWSPNESVDDFPVDLAARGSVSRMVGSTQLDLTTAGLDLILSRDFGVGGVANIAPYVSYSPAFIFARSGVLDSTPGTGDDPSNSFVFAEEEETLHRLVVGVRFVLGALNFTPEVALTKGIRSFNGNLGLDF